MQVLVLTFSGSEMTSVIHVPYNQKIKIKAAG